MAKKSRKKSSKGGRTESSIAEVPPPPTTSTAPIRTPVTINDLPDELLDDIALFTDDDSLPSLALVKRRFYEPTRRAMTWRADNFDQLLLLADLLFERPELAVLVRKVTLGVFTRREVDAMLARLERQEPTLALRLMKLIVLECPNLQVAHLRAGFPAKPAAEGRVKLAEEDLMRAAGTKDLCVADFGGSEDRLCMSSFLLAIPGLVNAWSLRVAVGIDTSFNRLSVPSIPLQSLELAVSDARIPQLSTLLEALASTTLVLKLKLLDMGSPPLPPLNSLTSLVQPYYKRALNGSFEICNQGAALRTLPLLDVSATHGGWVQFACVALLPLGYRAAPTAMCFGDGEQCYEKVAGMLEEYRGWRSASLTIRRGAWGKEMERRFEELATSRRIGLSWT